MTACEHHSQLLIPNGVRRKRLVDNRGDRPLGLEQPPYLGRKRARGALAPHDVERTILRRRHQPRGRVLRHAADLPHFQRTAEGVLDDVLCQRQVVHAEDSRERGDHPSRLAPEEVFVQIHSQP
jgi:hypothetical protein